MKLGKAILCVLIVSLLVSMAIPMVSAGKPPGKPPKDDPPADPAIAYFHQPSGPRPNELYVMNDDGSNKASICEDIYIRGGLSWSPDGGSITWAGNVGGSQYDGIWRIDVTVENGVPQGSNLQRIADTTGYFYANSAAWSPLGDEIVFVVGDLTSNNWWIKSVLATGGSLETIYSGNEIFINLYGVTWSSDATQIAFMEIEMSTSEKYIKIIERETGIPTNTLAEGQFSGPALFKVDWARQGIDALVTSGGTETIYIIDIETDTLTPVTAGASPSWSPDNSELVYVTTGRKPNISKIDLGSGEITKLASGQSPSWRR